MPFLLETENLFRVQAGFFHSLENFRDWRSTSMFFLLHFQCKTKMLLAPYAYVSQDRALCCYLDLWQYIFTVCLTSKEMMSVRLEYLTFDLGCLAVALK